MKALRIPYSFAQQLRVRLSWSDVQKAYRRELLSRDFARDKANDEIDADLNDSLLSLSISTDLDEALAIVARLALDEDDTNEEDRVLYLAIAYLRHCETDKTRLLDLMEEIYADFDYPSRIASTVRYMPMDGPDLGSRDANEDRLVANIDIYLKNQWNLLTHSPP